MNEVSPKGGGQDARNKKSPLIFKRAFYLIRICFIFIEIFSLHPLDHYHQV